MLLQKGLGGDLRTRIGRELKGPPRFFKSLSAAFSILCLGLLSSYSSCSSKDHKPTLVSEIKIERKAYELVYDGQHKQPRWVYEHLTKDRVDGPVDRAK